jgi:hypothetical protein
MVNFLLLNSILNSIVNKNNFCALIMRKNVIAPKELEKKTNYLDQL